MKDTCSCANACSCCGDSCQCDGCGCKPQRWGQRGFAHLLPIAIIAVVAIAGVVIFATANKSSKTVMDYTGDESGKVEVGNVPPPGGGGQGYDKKCITCAIDKTSCAVSCNAGDVAVSRDTVGTGRSCGDNINPDRQKQYWRTTVHCEKAPTTAPVAACSCQGGTCSSGCGNAGSDCGPAGGGSCLPKPTAGVGGGGGGQSYTCGNSNPNGTCAPGFGCAADSAGNWSCVADSGQGPCPVDMCNGIKCETRYKAYRNGKCDYADQCDPHKNNIGGNPACGGKAPCDPNAQDATSCTAAGGKWALRTGKSCLSAYAVNGACATDGCEGWDNATKCNDSASCQWKSPQTSSCYSCQCN